MLSFVFLFYLNINKYEVDLQTEIAISNGNVIPMIENINLPVILYNNKNIPLAIYDNNPSKGNLKPIVML